MTSDGWVHRDPCNWRIRIPTTAREYNPLCTPKNKGLDWKHPIPMLIENLDLPLQHRLKTLPSHHKRDNCRHIALRRAKEPSKSCAKGAWSCSDVASREVIQVANDFTRQ